MGITEKLSFSEGHLVASLRKGIHLSRFRGSNSIGDCRTGYDNFRVPSLCGFSSFERRKGPIWSDNLYWYHFGVSIPKDNERGIYTGRNGVGDGGLVGKGGQDATTVNCLSVVR